MRDKLPGRGILVFCLGLIFLAGLIVTTAVAQQDPNKKTPPVSQPPPEQKSETVTVKGTVTAVTDSTLTVVDDQKVETTVVLDKTTTVTKSGKDATVADLKTDDSVVIIAKKGEADALMAIKITAA